MNLRRTVLGRDGGGIPIQRQDILFLKSAEGFRCKSRCHIFAKKARTGRGPARISDSFRKSSNLAVERAGSISTGMFRMGTANRLNFHTDAIAVKYWHATLVKHRPTGLTRDKTLLLQHRKAKAAFAKIHSWRPERIVLSHGRCFESHGNEVIRRIFGGLAP